MKKWIMIALAAALVAVSLTGCQGQLSSTFKQTGSPSTAATTPASNAPSDSIEPQPKESAAVQPAISSAVASAPNAVQPAQNTTASVDNRSKLSVTTTETVKVLPDMATVTLGVTTQGNSADAAQNANSKIANAVVAAIKAQGIKDEDIQTSNINLYQDYTDTKKYNMEIDYNVKVTQIANVGKVIDAAISAGANVTYSLVFDIQDKDTVYMQALQKAMTSVADKAQKMATAGGLTLDRVLDVQETSQSNVIYPMAAAMDSKAAAGAPVNVSPGQIDVSASVTATYLLK
ncbi:MAG: SIMPL domain-containing protein [Eubacteriales bacterium]